MKISVCMPEQHDNREDKLQWLSTAMKEAGSDLFLTPQEYFGGHYVMPKDLHIEATWMKEHCSRLAKEHDCALGVGACVKHTSGGATEDYMYFDRDGAYVGYHRKFALPSYDDNRCSGAGNLWPEIDFKSRSKPVKIPSLGLTVGTIFCWEIFSLAVPTAYAYEQCNLIAHPIKFAPRGWLKLKNDEESGERRIIGFDQQPKSQMWVDRIHAISKHVCLCPVAASCNSWNLGEKYKAVVGHVDEILRRSDLRDVPSVGSSQYVHNWEFNPSFYSAMRTSMHNIGAFKGATGSTDHYHELGEWTMHLKMHRLEAQLVGGTTRLEAKLLASTRLAQKKSIQKRFESAHKKSRPKAAR